MVSYRIFIRLLLPFLFLKLMQQARQSHQAWCFWQQKWGFNYPHFSQRPQWIHCASLGEVHAAKSLIQRTMQTSPLIISVNSPAGFTAAQNLLQYQQQYPTQVVYLPLDLSAPLKRFLQKIQPQSLWIMETEIWPELYTQVHQAHIPIMLVNARIGTKSLKAPKLIRQWLSLSLQKTQKILARTPEDSQGFTQLGVEPSKIHITGNLKWMSDLSKTPKDYPRLIPQEYLLLASSREGDEELVIDAWQQLNPCPLLIIVPRHLKRTKEIVNLLKNKKIPFQLYSQKPIPNSPTQILLVDAFGLMMPLFAHSSVVIMGGAFSNKGGHNLLEPASLGKAIITGSDMADFAEETALLLKNNAMIQTENTDLANHLNNLWQNPQLQQTLGQNALTTLQQQQHILNTTWQALHTKT